MTHDPFARIKEVLLQLADLNESERAAHLDDACSDDPELRARIESLLVHETDGSSLGISAAAHALRQGLGSESRVGSTPRPDEVIGRTLAHYKVIEKIGAGGMGDVYRARDTKLGRDVALKVLPPAAARDEERRRRFEREAKAIASLQHPHIVTIHSIEETDGVHFLTMELVGGKDLNDLLAPGGLPLDRVFEIGIPLADAAHAAHERGVVHRDLKPGNVMVDEARRVKVLDFGLAKLTQTMDVAEGATITAGDSTQAGRILGTVAYMSPEQAEGKDLDRRSDIFSLGVILYELLTGERPFEGESLASTMSAILRDTPLPVTDRRPTLPRDADRIVRRCLAKDPARRYQTALDVRTELEELRAEMDSGIHAATTQGTAVPSRRPRLSVLLGALALIVIAVTTTLQLRNGGRAPTIHYVPRPITATHAWDAHPRWSPDGKSIAFVRMASGHADIYVKPVDGGPAVLRVGGPGDQDVPRWTPDGRYLAYVSLHKPGSPLYVVPSDGGTPRELIVTNIPTLEFDGAEMGDRPWSSDGETLLVSIRTDAQRLAVHRVDRSSGRLEQITFPPPGSDDSNATHSFDGKRILFRRTIEGAGALMLMPAEGGEPEVLLHDGFSYSHMAWRPDNRRVVFAAARGAVFKSLFQIDVVTRKIDPLWSGTEDANGLSVSLDDRVVFSTFSHDQFLYMADVETGERVELTSHAADNRDARVAPDGRAIAYASDRTGNAEIWLHHLDGRPETQFTDDRGHDAKPAWSPDGRRIVFLSDRDADSFKLFVANTDGGTEPRLLTDQATNWGRGGSSLLSNNPVARWSPDGDAIMYRVIGDAGPELWTIDPDGLNARKRLDGVTGFDWYHDSRRALITRRSGTEEELLAVDLESGREEALFTGAIQELDGAPDGSAVAFCYGQGHLSMGLAVLRLEAPSDPEGLPRVGGEPRYVVPSEESWHVHNGGWTPDSKSLVYIKDTDHGDIYELVVTR